MIRSIEPEARASYPAAVTERLPAEQRRRQLLDVALQAFAERGFHPTSMNDVAEAAGVTKPVLYQHFASKRHLYLELLEDVGGRLEAAIGKATAGAEGPHGQVEAGFRAYFDFAAADHAAFRVLFGGGTRRDEEFAERVRRVEDSIAETIAPLIDVAGITPERQRLLAHGLVGLAEGTSRHWAEQGFRPDAAELASQVAELAWAGLRGVDPG